MPLTEQVRQTRLISGLLPSVLGITTGLVALLEPKAAQTVGISALIYVALYQQKIP